MTREQYMQTLHRYLAHISAEELEEVRVYYHELFEEAGIGRYDQVPESFGNSKMAALEILANVGEEKKGGGSAATPPQTESKGFWERAKENWVIILLALLAFPVGIPLILALGGVLLGLVGAVVGIIVALGAMVVAPIVILFKAAALTVPTTFFLAGIIALGVGLLMLLVGFIHWIIEAVSNAIRRRVREGKEGRHHE